MTETAGVKTARPPIVLHPRCQPSDSGEPDLAPLGPSGHPSISAILFAPSRASRLQLKLPHFNSPAPSAPSASSPPPTFRVCVGIPRPKPAPPLAPLLRLPWQESGSTLPELRKGKQTMRSNLPWKRPSRCQTYSALIDLASALRRRFITWQIEQIPNAKADTAGSGIALGETKPSESICPATSP